MDVKYLHTTYVNAIHGRIKLWKCDKLEEYIYIYIVLIKINKQYLLNNDFKYIN